MGITDKISHAAERKAFETIPDGKWAHYTQRLIRENDPYILKTFLTNAAYEGGFRGYKTAQENAAKYDINVPWLILMDPTSACICTAPAAGRRNMAISSIWIWIPSIPSSVRARKWAPICISTPAASPWSAKRT